MITQQQLDLLKEVNNKNITDVEEVLLLSLVVNIAASAQDFIKFT